MLIYTKGALIEFNGRLWEIKKLIEKHGDTYARLKRGLRRKTVPIEDISAYMG